MGLMEEPQAADSQTIFRIQHPKDRADLERKPTRTEPQLLPTQNHHRARPPHRCFPL
jgi:hypothetical protein